MYTELFENIYKESNIARESAILNESYDDNIDLYRMRNIFKNALFHPTVDYPGDVKAAMAFCIRNFTESTYNLYDVYKLVENVYNSFSKLNSKLTEGVYADNLGDDVEKLVLQARNACDKLINRRLELNIVDSEMSDVENKLFAIADIYKRTYNLLTNDHNFRGEGRDILNKLLYKIRSTINPALEEIKQYILNADINNINIYHCFGRHEKIDLEDLNLKYYIDNLRFADQNAYKMAFAA